MISFRQADLMTKVEDDKNSIIWTLVFYTGGDGDSVDSQIKTVRQGHVLSTFMQQVIVTIQDNLERSWNLNRVREIDLDSNRYALPVGATERGIYKNTADAIGNTLKILVPYYFKGKMVGGVLPTGGVYVTYKIKDIKYPTGTEVKFKYDGKEFHGIVQAVSGDGTVEVKVDVREEADLADSNVLNPVKIIEGESWLQPL
jgi:hypothetical protein